MKTPWINYKGIGQINQRRQTTYFFSSSSEPSKLQSIGENEAMHPETETNSEQSKLDDSLSPTDTNDFKSKTGESIETQEDFHSIPDKINDNTIRQIVRKRSPMIRRLPTVTNYYLEYKYKTDLPSNLDITKCIGLKKDREVFITFGLSRLVEEIQSNLPFVLSLVPELPIIVEDPAAEMIHEPVAFIDHDIEDIPVTDFTFSQIELDDEKSFLDEPDIPGAIDLKEINEVAKQEGIVTNYYLEYKYKTDLPSNLDITKCIGLKKDREVFITFGLSRLVEEIQSNLPFVLSLVPELPIIVEDPAAEMIHEPVAFIDHDIEDIPVTDFTFSQIELDDEKSFLDEPDIPGAIDLKEINEVAKQEGIVQLVNLLTRVQLKKIEVPIEVDQPKSETEQPKSETEQPSTSRAIDNSNGRLEMDEANGHEPSDDAVPTSQDNNVYWKVIETPFSTFIEIDDFLHAPISGEVSQHTIEFHEPGAQSFEIDSKFISTTAYYPHKPTCQLIKSTIHEVVYLTKKTVGNESRKQKSPIAKSAINPLHRSSKKRKSNQRYESIKIRVPVVLGEYKIEICIEEEVLFGHKAVTIKEISKDVVLTNCDFIPNRYVKAQEEGTRLVTNGLLVIEGLIVQNIEYTARFSENESSQTNAGNLLHEIMTIELVVQLLQEQGIQVNCREIKHNKNV